ncbi:hypothetical protein [Maribellus maritimus]|uniref:hypothetical protein n=1 Tax=Maribellus maritimus TaxID=2870838 RepID=UPI001EEAE74C|nr:hypothetical protein [Maribellus maritimus]MCG6191388.1 hypothetical protein [Maribellus maritimus]
MKTKKLKLLTIFLFLFPLCVVLLGAGCEKEVDYSNLVEGYVVGSFVCSEVDSDGQATGNNTERGYCILLEDSENANSHWPMDFYTFDFPPGIFEFPEEIISPTHNSNDGGPNFFPDSIRNKYHIVLQYKEQINSEKIQFGCGFYTMLIPFPWENYKQITLNQILLKKD